MRVEYGQKAVNGEWAVRLVAPNVSGGVRMFESTSEAAAYRLAVQLAGGRRDKVRRVTFLAEAEAPAVADASEPSAPVARSRVTALLNQSARKIAAELAGGKWDDVLEIIESVETETPGGPRKTVSTAIRKRRNAGA
jgi:hypothetical protein